MKKWMNVCVMYMSGALSLGPNRNPQCANIKHVLLMIPVLVWWKRVDPSDAIFTSRAQAGLQSLFVRKILLTGENNCWDNNCYLLVASWTHSTWTVTSITTSVIMLLPIIRNWHYQEKGRSWFCNPCPFSFFVILIKSRIVKACSLESWN